MTRTAFWPTALALLATFAFTSAALAQEISVVSGKADTAPVIDGKRDDVWVKAKSVTVPLAKLMYTPTDYKGIQTANVTLSSLHDGEYIYFLVQWADPTQSLELQPWAKLGASSWKQKRNADPAGHDNTYGQDKFGMLWNINTPGFEARGCAVVCHRGRGGKIGGVSDNGPGRKYTDKAGAVVDMWLWGSVTTNPVAQLDDGFIDDTRDPAKSAAWGRKKDEGAGGPSENANAAKDAPAFMSQAPEGKYWVRDDQKAPFADTHNVGDMIGSVVVAPFSGSRGDISGMARWENGVWTLEIKRKLVTGGADARTQDVQFDDLKKAYFFGISVFDNTEMAHLYHEGALKLTFN